jgi:hypothetical protein
MRWWGQHRAAECTKPTVPPTRRRRLRAALAAVLVPHNAPKLHLKREWLDNWLGIGLIIAGMTPPQLGRAGLQLEEAERGAERGETAVRHGFRGPSSLSAEARPRCRSLRQ